MRLLWKYVDRCTNRLVAESWITKGQESRTHWEYCAKIISVYWIWKCQYLANELMRIDHSINIGLSERAREDRQVDLMFLQCAWISLNSDCVTFDVLTFLFIFALKISFIYIPSCILPHSFNWIWSWVSCERRTRLQSNHSGSSLRSVSSRLNQLSELVGQPAVVIAQALKEVNLSKMGVWSSLGRGVLLSLDKGKDLTHTL